MATIIVESPSHNLSVPLILDLGSTTLIITSNRELVFNIIDRTEPGTVQLGSTEAYRLYASLHTLFKNA